MRKNNQYTIQQVANLFSGVYINTSSNMGNSVYYLQVRHWNKHRQWMEHVQPELHEEERLQKNFLEIGDVLLATKGVDHFAVIYDGLYSPAIASSVFTVIRVKRIMQILPVYLQWFLNHPSTKEKLVNAAKGTSTPHISRDVIEQLTLPVPAIEKQQLILRASELQQQALRIHTQINHLTESIYNSNLLKIAYK